MTPEIVLEYLKVLLSWPVVTGIISLIAIKTFRPQIAALLGRPLKLEWPGGGASFGSQDKTSKAELPTNNAIPAIPASSEVVALPQSVSPSSSEAQDIVHLVRSERANAALWEYRYLNLFLVRGTQVVLDWLATLPNGISSAFFDSQLQAFITAANERFAILNALQKHHLVSINADLISITDKGREYLTWRGPLPPPLPAGAV